MITTVAQKLAEFHQRAETNKEITAFGRLGVILYNCDEKFAQTEKYQSIKNYTNRFIDSNTSLSDKRVREGKIRDCHGDLHAAHVCLTDDICIYDCIEFNDRSR